MIGHEHLAIHMCKLDISDLYGSSFDVSTKPIESSEVARNLAGVNVLFTESSLVFLFLSGSSTPRKASPLTFRY